MIEDLIAFGVLIGGLAVIGVCAHVIRGSAVHRELTERERRYLKEYQKPLRRRHF